MASTSPDSPPRAVFLSYAREDTEAAKRIADALRAFGVEVWFDQSELRGGDQWDTKIKKQIRECALFMPIISATTEARPEGYFRREWLLAAERTRDMAGGVAFIVPVVTDDTPEGEASVPEEFMRFQWTRLAHGVPSPQFVEQIKRLLEAPRKPASTRATASSAPRAAEKKSFTPIVATAVVIVALGGVALFLSRKSEPPATAKPVGETNAAPAAAPQSEVRKLVEKAKALQDEYAMDDTLRDNLALAEDLCKRAVALDPTDGEAWAVSARISLSLLSFESSNARLEQARSQVQRALKLAPDFPEVRLAQADSLRKQGGPALAEAERILRDLVQHGPPDKRVLRMLALVLNGAGRADEALVYYDRANALPGGDSKALLNRATILFRQSRFAEAEAAVNESLALRPTASARIVKIQFMLRRGELDAAQALLDAVPASSLIDDRAAFIASLVWIRKRQPEKAIAVLRAAARDFFDDPYVGRTPRAALVGDAQYYAGRIEAAQAEWRTALRAIDQRLVAAPNDTNFLSQRAYLLARLGNNEEATRVVKLVEDLTASDGNYLPIDRDWDAAQFFVALGQNTDALGRLESMVRQTEASPWRDAVSRPNALRLDPFWDPLRGEMRFAAVIKALEEKKK